MIKVILLKLLASKILKGKLTNLAAASTVVLPILQAFGIDILPTEWDAVAAGVLASITIFGRVRARFQGG